MLHSATLISAIIDKNDLNNQYILPDNPYNISLKFNLERLYMHLSDLGQANAKTFCIFEKRGKKEDKNLELEFRRICDGDNRCEKEFPFDIVFASKKTNSCGLQLADLVARPIGIKTLRPSLPNRAFDILQKKFRCNPKTGAIRGWGVKKFP